MIKNIAKTDEIKKVQYICDRCGTKSKIVAKGVLNMPSGWIEIGFITHYCPLCMKGIRKRVETASK